MSDDKMTTYEMADGEPIYGEFSFMTDDVFITDGDWDEPEDFVVTEWQRVTRKVIRWRPRTTLCDVCGGECGDEYGNPCTTCGGDGQHPLAGKIEILP